MEILTSNNEQMIHSNIQAVSDTSSGFIEANTQEVTFKHLKEDCIIPVFSKDNESTISHYQFINVAYNTAKELFPEAEVSQPRIRVSHMIKGRIPGAVGKPVKELIEEEKTIYYERCAFLIDIPSLQSLVNESQLTLSIGGVRAYNQENLYSSKSLEKFKMFIGYKNMVCTNLCISTDGFANQLRVASIGELEQKIKELIYAYDPERHLRQMEELGKFKLTERQFAHFIGKLRMYPNLDKSSKKEVFPIAINDVQVTRVVRDYYQCLNFGREADGSINLWRLYNLLTEANKSSYIDYYTERSVSAFELINYLRVSIEKGTPNWLLY